MDIYSRMKGWEIQANMDMKVPDKIDETIIKQRMTTKIFGTEIVSLSSTKSTNMVAKEMAVKGCKEGMVIIADEQTGGRGRMGREWISPFGKGIWMSLVLKPSIAPSKAPLITSMVAVAVANAIEATTGLKPNIKWPNDVLINDKKVCGILTEMQGNMDTIEYLVVGIGINVNLNYNDFPEELRSKATSLKIEYGDIISRVDLIRRILEELEYLYTDYSNTEDTRNIISAVEERSATIGKRIRVTGVDTDLEGVAVGIADDGALMLMLDNGKIKKIMSGDVSIRGMDGYV